MERKEIRLYLDDERPCPPGWTVARSASAALELLTDPGYEVTEMSFDHDLGACAKCIRTVAEAAAHLTCRHVPTGYDLAKAMAEGGLLPARRPRVHSMNPIGRGNLEALFDLFYGGDGSLKQLNPGKGAAPTRVRADRLTAGALVLTERGAATVAGVSLEAGRVAVEFETGAGVRHVEKSDPDELYETV